MVLDGATRAGPPAHQKDDLAIWIEKRKALFEQWQVAHPHIEADLAGLKQRAVVPTTPPDILSGTSCAVEIWDSPNAPQMVVIPAGKYTMGSPESEEERFENEGPPHCVSIGSPIAVGKYEVTRAEFSCFVANTGYHSKPKCYGYVGKTELKCSSRFTWQNPGFEQTDQDPVVCVSWDDAKAYVGWLSERTGKNYRLLSEAEWEYAARAQTTTARWWGAHADDGCTSANGASLDIKALFPDWTVANYYNGYVLTAPVGCFAPNGFGLYDMLGNVWEWVEDCWNDRYMGAPLDGSAWLSGNCDLRVLRGGSWHSNPRAVRSAARYSHMIGSGHAAFGFRVARTV
jgi:formylglycine-generating enzyme required for sulfatase activity